MQRTCAIRMVGAKGVPKGCQMILTPERIEQKAQERLKRAGAFVSLETVIVQGLLNTIERQRMQIDALQDANTIKDRRLSEYEAVNIAS